MSVSNYKNFDIIHIGKCGGSTVSEELINNSCHPSYNNWHHICQVKYESDKQYIILLRNPIQRFISAFNFQKKRNGDSPEELIELNKYKDVNFLAENLYKNEILNVEIVKSINKKYNTRKTHLHIPSIDKISHPSHLGMDINYYLSDFLEKCPKKEIIGIICTETMKEDLKELFNINLQKHIHKTNISDKKISILAYKNLKKYLNNDYRCIDKLFKIGVIDEKKYNLLSL